MVHRFCNKEIERFWGDIVEKLRIEWNDKTKGFMELNVNEFFPCTLKTAEKVFQLMVQYCPEKFSELLEYLNQKRNESFMTGKENHKKFLEAHQKVIDLKRLVETKKHPIGTYLTESEYSQAKVDLKSWTQSKRTFVTISKKMSSKVQRLDRNIKLIEKYMKGSDC